MKKNAKSSNLKFHSLEVVSRYRDPQHQVFEIPDFLFQTCISKKKYEKFVSISSLTGEGAAQKLKNFCSSSLWTCLHHMVILRIQNKITDFFIILA